MVKMRTAHIVDSSMVRREKSVHKELFDKINNGELVGQNSILQWVKAAKKRKWGEDAISWLKGDEVSLKELRMKNRTGELKTTRSIVGWVKTQQNLKEFAKFDDMGGVNFKLTVKTEKSIVIGCFGQRKKTACVEKVAKTAKTTWV